MTLQRLKILLCLSAALITVAALIAFLAAPYLGSFYLLSLCADNTDLPRLTGELALPLLRIDPLAPSRYPVTSWWVFLIWGLIIVAPILFMVWSVKTSNVKQCLARWVGSVSLYLSMVMMLSAVIAAGLLIAIAPFPCMNLM